MKKLVLSQAEIDKLVVVERRVVAPTVYGVGRNDVGFQVVVNGIDIWQYVLWVAMLQRGADEKFKVRRKTYRDVTVCDEWLSFSNFFEWVNKEVDYKGKPVGMELDKDLLSRGNKVYCPNTCSFVPQALNKLLIDCGNSRGEWPLGVDYHKPSCKFRAAFKGNGKFRHMGSYGTPEEAFLAYKTAKESHIKSITKQHKDVLKPAVYESLMNWEIEP